MSKKSGYVAIIGKPNAGKSTLLNSILGSKLSIVTPKPQTTRKNVSGIYTKDEVQIVFFDTPGILKPRYELQKRMMDNLGIALADAEIFLLIADLSDCPNPEKYFNVQFLESLKQSGKPILLALNKIDLLKLKKNSIPFVDKFYRLGFFDEIIPISALQPNNIDELLKVIIDKLPESDFYYDPESISYQSERFFASEIIREHIFKDFELEVPYSADVTIIEYKERSTGKWYISADIIVERNSQKKIIVGANGEKIKQIGEKSRKDIEELIGNKVYLELFVKVREKWRQNKAMLSSLGYK